MKKGNWILPLAVLLIAGALLFAGTRLMKPAADENVVIITVDGAEYKRVPLSSPGDIEIRQENGEVNVVRVSENGAVMLSSTCHNQQCVRMGEVTVENWETRPNQAYIICLPNRVTVELVVKE